MSRLNKLLKELNSLIGLEQVKTEVNRLISEVKINKEREQNGLKTSSSSYHMLFLGNPGTGKTVVARIVAKIFAELGLVSQGHVIEATRMDFIGEYVGQTAPRTHNLISRAYGGVLFIDEAYSLVSPDTSNDYGLEAVSILLKEMEDNRDKFIVIAAGYEKEMETFLNSNTGLKSRFTKSLHFEDYSLDDLVEIFFLICKKEGYVVIQQVEEELKEVFKGLRAQQADSWANGRSVRNFFEQVKRNQNDRLARDGKSSHSKLELSAITAEDLGIKTKKNNENESNYNSVFLSYKDMLENYESLVQEKDALKKELKEIDEKHALKHELKQEELKEIDEKYALKQEELKIYINENNTLKNRIFNLEDELKVLNTNLDNANELVAAKENELEKSAEENARLENDVSVLNDRIKALEVELSKTETMLTDKSNKLELYVKMNMNLRKKLTFFVLCFFLLAVLFLMFWSGKYKLL